MAIIVNGVNIPTNGDFIKVENTNIDKVICNGVTVWEKQKDSDVISALQNGTLPYTVYHGPDVVYGTDEDNEEISKPIYHRGWNESSSNQYDTAITVSDGKIYFYTSASDPMANADYIDFTGTQYIEFSLDVTPYKKVKVVGTGTGNSTPDASISNKISLLFDSEVIFNHDFYHRKIYKEDEPDEIIFIGGALNQEVDITSKIGIKTVRLQGNFYSYGGGNRDLKMDITQFLFS